MLRLVSAVLLLTGVVAPTTTQALITELFTTTTATAPTDTTTVTFPQTTTTKYVCEDLNTDACRQLNASKAGYCDDVSLSMSICPRFCGHCPSVCYHCNDAVRNISDCTTTKVCAQNEICMIKQLRSSVDGHHEYELSCEDKQVCDGNGLAFAFGRRAVESRDISVHCCKEDYCNYPAQLKTTTTRTTAAHVTMATGCSRDIIFMIDTSNRYSWAFNHGSHSSTVLQSSLQLVHDIVAQLNIGPYDNLVSLATFDHSVHNQWDLKDHMNKADLLNAIAHVHQRVQFNAHGDIGDAVNFLLKHAMESNHGDRRSYPDDVIIITDSASPFHDALQTYKLHRESRDVIVVSVGVAQTAGTVSDLATDDAHKIHVSSYADLPRIGGQLFNLLCT